MKRILIFAIAGTLAAFAVACSDAGEANRNTTKENATTSPAASVANTNAGGGSSRSTNAPKDDVPANVHTALADAQTIQKQHKDLSASQIASIEKETNTKLKDTDHHSYLGFSTADGARKQTGAATVVEANGKQMVVVYESRNGSPFIKDVRAEGVPQAFLDQFKGKGHDDKFQIGGDLKANGVDDATAKAAAAAIRQDAMIMQTLYGSAHSH